MHFCFLRVSVSVGLWSLITLFLIAPLISLLAAPVSPEITLSTDQNYDLQVVAGQTVRWHNTSTSPHRLHAIDGSWATPLIQPGETVTQTFTMPRQSLFVCDIDPTMRGVVTVQSGNTIFVPLLVVSRTVERWSQPETWGGSLPQAGAAVTIPAGKVVLLDTSPLRCRVY